MELTSFDFILLAIFGAFIVFGMFRGLSGQIGTVIGLLAAAIAFPILRPIAEACAVHIPYADAAPQAAACVINGLLALVVFGIARRIAARFLSFLLPQPLNAILGMAVGALKGIVVVILLALSGLLFTDTCAGGIAATHSTLIQITSGWIDSFRVESPAEGDVS